MTLQTYSYNYLLNNSFWLVLSLNSWLQSCLKFRLVVFWLCTQFCKLLLDEKRNINEVNTSYCKYVDVWQWSPLCVYNTTHGGYKLTCSVVLVDPVKCVYMFVSDCACTFISAISTTSLSFLRTFRWGNCSPKRRWIW